MDVQRIAAFSSGAQGGNPAGIVLCQALPDAAAMKGVAAEIGYSETAFAAQEDGEWRVRYFAPEAELDFCAMCESPIGTGVPRVSVWLS